MKKAKKHTGIYIKIVDNHKLNLKKTEIREKCRLSVLKIYFSLDIGEKKGYNICGVK